MKKTISLVITSAIVGSVVLSGCNAKDIINNIPTKATETTASTTEETTIPTETVAIENTYETIPAPTPQAPDEEALNYLYSCGYTKNDLRRRYTFDNNDLNREENKLYVIDRMCNSVDYFSTIQASYTTTVNNKTTWVTYAIDQRVNKAKEILYNISNNNEKFTPTRYVYVDGDYHVKLLVNDKFKENYTFDYNTSNKKPHESMIELINKPIANEFGEDIKANSNASSGSINLLDYTQYLDITRRFINIGTPDFYALNRSDYIGLITAPEHYFPDLYATDNLIDLSNWRIDSVETKSNREIICMSGKYKDKYYDYERSIKLEIDKNTGVIMSREEYNESGKLVEDMKCVHLMVDADLDENIFDKFDPKDIVDTRQ